MLLLALAKNLDAAEITVFAAASLSESLREITAKYEKQSGDKIVLNLDASSTLARQIEAGAPCDIFFSADDAKMDALAAKGLVVESTRRERLGNSLVIVVSAGSKLELGSAGDLATAKIKHLALAEPATVPAGIYARKYLETQNLWRNIEPKVIPTQNVRAALAAVESENVEAAIVYKTDAATSRRVRIAFEIPAADTPDIHYPLALLKESKVPLEAGKFLDHLNSEEAATIFARHGFIVKVKSDQP